MNWLDVLIVSGLLGAGLLGMQRGLVREICRTGTTLLALLLAYRFAGPWSVSLATRFALAPGFAQGATFGAVVLGVATLGYAAEPWVYRIASSASSGVVIDRWGGFILGLVKGGALTLLFVVGASQMPWQVAHRALSESALALHILQLAPALYSQVYWAEQGIL